jgi:hypothetical protein
MRKRLSGDVRTLEIDSIQAWSTDHRIRSIDESMSMLTLKIEEFRRLAVALREATRLDPVVGAGEEHAIE